MSLNKFEQTIQNIGKVFEKVFVDVDKAAVIAEPFVDIAFPVIAPLYNAAASGAATATAAAKSAVVSTNTPVQNLVAIAAAIEPILNQYATEAGLSAPTLTVLMQYAQALQTALTAAERTKPLCIGQSGFEAGPGPNIVRGKEGRARAERPGPRLLIHPNFRPCATATNLQRQQRPEGGHER